MVKEFKMLYQDIVPVVVAIGVVGVVVGALVVPGNVIKKKVGY